MQSETIVTQDTPFAALCKLLGFPVKIWNLFTSRPRTAEEKAQRKGDVWYHIEGISETWSEDLPDDIRAIVGPVRAAWDDPDPACANLDAVIRNLPEEYRQAVSHAMPAGIAGWVAAFMQSVPEFAELWRGCPPTLKIERTNADGNVETIMTSLEPCERIIKAWNLDNDE